MRKFTGAGVAVGFFLLCIWHAPLLRDAVAEGLQLLLTVALPALFPFFFGAALLVQAGGATLLGRLLAPLFARVYRLPACAAGVFLLSITGGYPVGVQATVQLYQQGQLTRAQANHLLTFANNTGPAFLVGLCGGILGNPLWGGVLYGVHIGSALLVGWLLRDRHAVPIPRGREVFVPCPPLLTCFVASVQQAGMTSLRISGFVLVFVVLCRLCQQLGVLVWGARLLLPLQWLWGGTADTRYACACSLLELTFGLQQFPRAQGAGLLPYMGFATAFGGLSVWAQSASLLADTPLALSRLWWGKMLHAGLAGLAMWGVWQVGGAHAWWGM